MKCKQEASCKCITIYFLPQLGNQDPEPLSATKKNKKEFSFQYVNSDLPMRQPGYWIYGARTPERDLLRVGLAKEETGWVGAIYDLIDGWVIEARVLKES